MHKISYVTEIKWNIKTITKFAKKYKDVYTMIAIKVYMKIYPK